MKNSIAMSAQSRQQAPNTSRRSHIARVATGLALYALVAPSSSAWAVNAKDVERAQTAVDHAQRDADLKESDYKDAKSNCDDIENGTITAGSEKACERCDTQSQNGNLSACYQDVIDCSNPNQPLPPPRNCSDIYNDNGGTTVGLSNGCARLVKACADVWKDDALKKCQEQVKKLKKEMNQAKEKLDAATDLLATDTKNCKDCNKAENGGTGQYEMNGAQKTALVLNSILPYALAGGSAYMQDRSMNLCASNYQTYAQAGQSFGTPVLPANCGGFSGGVGVPGIGLGIGGIGGGLGIGGGYGGLGGYPGIGGIGGLGGIGYPGIGGIGYPGIGGGIYGGLGGYPGIGGIGGLGGIGYPGLGGLGGGLYGGLGGYPGLGGLGGGLYGGIGGYPGLGGLGGLGGYPGLGGLGGGLYGGIGGLGGIGGYPGLGGLGGLTGGFGYPTAGYGSGFGSPFSGLGGLGGGIYGGLGGLGGLGGSSLYSPWGGIGLGNAQYGNSYQASMLSQQLQLQRAQQSQQDLMIYQQQAGDLSMRGQQIYSQMYSLSNPGYLGGSGFGGYGGFGGGIYGGLYGSSLSNPFSGYSNIYGGTGSGGRTF